MNIIAACRIAKDEGFQLVRYRKDSVKSGIAEYDVKPGFTGNKRGWIVLDSFTASAIVAVYDSLEKTQPAETLAKIYRIPLGKLASFAFKHVGGGILLTTTNSTATK